MIYKFTTDKGLILIDYTILLICLYIPHTLYWEHFKRLNTLNIVWKRYNNNLEPFYKMRSQFNFPLPFQHINKQEC